MRRTVGEIRQLVTEALEDDVEVALEPEIVLDLINNYRGSYLGQLLHVVVQDEDYEVGV